MDNHYFEPSDFTPSRTWKVFQWAKSLKSDGTLLLQHADFVGSYGAGFYCSVSKELPKWKRQGRHTILMTAKLLV